MTELPRQIGDNIWFDIPISERQWLPSDFEDGVTRETLSEAAKRILDTVAEIYPSARFGPKQAKRAGGTPTVTIIIDKSDLD